MCGGYTTHSHDVPAVNTRINPEAAPVQSQAQSASRRINATELAKQVASLVQNSGKVSRTDEQNGVKLTEYTLRRGLTKAVVQTAASPYGESATNVRVTRNRKLLLSADADGIGAVARFLNAEFTPGSWTKPFRLVDLSASQG